MKRITLFIIFSLFLVKFVSGEYTKETSEELGLTFGIGWSACIGPILAFFLLLASTELFLKEFHCYLFMH